MIAIKDKKTLLDLARLVQQKEHELASGGETTVLGAFVLEYGHVSEIIENYPYLDGITSGSTDCTEAYYVYVSAYKRLENGFEDIW